MPVDHHDHDKIVELRRVPSRLEADLIVARLQEAGITATVNYGDIAGYLRGSGIAGGNQILVFDCDIERALAVLDRGDESRVDADAAPAPAPPPPAPTGRGRRRH